MLTGVLIYLRQNQGLTTGDFIQTLTDNTTCAIDFKAVLTLPLTENRGFGFAEINKLAPDLSMEGAAFRLKKHLILTLCFRTPNGVQKTV